MAGQPTTRPTATPPLEPAAEQAMPPVAQRPDAGAADEDLPLDVVIVLQRAPLPGAQNAGQQNSQADQLRAPANAAPATSPAAPPPAAR